MPAGQRVTLFRLTERQHGFEVQIEDSGATFNQGWMHLEYASHDASAPVNLSCAGRVLVRERWAGNQLGLGHQALGSPLGLQQPRLSVVSGKDRGSQMRDLDRQTCRLFVNFAADLKQAERIEALAVFDEVLADSG